MSKEAPPSRSAPQFVVRFPDETFRGRLADAAKANNRSMNAEIVARLESSFAPGEAYVTKDQFSQVFGRMQGEHDNTLMALGTIRDLLSTFVLTLYARLHPRERDKEENQSIRAFAESVKSTDEEQVRKAFRKIFEGTAAIVENADDTREAEAANFFADTNRRVTMKHRKLLQLDERPLDLSRKNP